MPKSIPIIIIILSLLSVRVSARQPTQTIRGTIIDEASNVPLAYASVGLQNTTKGAFSDSLGNFVIKNVAIGRYDVKVSLIGYEPAVLREVQVTSAKEVFLHITMKESINILGEVIVEPGINKEEPINPMASVSAKMVSVEEAKRYAGGFDDPARLVSAFAGVSSNVQSNAIVVRGNNPQALQWKLEGVEISNPNHFADMAAFGGGGLTALSAQVLANSDFLSGAMPAEYSNALAGVFDIYMRNGNNEKRENTFQLGAIGIDIASEGPFKKGKSASYIFNYRYSTLSLLTPLLPENADGTNYQDVTFKLNFPTRKTGTFSVWGIGLLDRSDAKAKPDINKWKYYTDRENLDVKQSMGAAGISHKILLNQKQYLKTTLAATLSGINMHTTRLDSSLNAVPENVADNTQYNLVLDSFLNTKFNAHHTNKTGIVITNMNYDLLLEQAAAPGNSLQTLAGERGHSTLASAYSNSMMYINDKLSVHAGINVQWFTLNNAFSVEPRAGLKYKLSSTQTLGLAYGLHSRLERISYYFITDNLNREINKKLNFTKAHHVVLGYDISISEFIHAKFEAYYQYLFNVPVMAGNSFSLINQQNDWFFDGKLQPTGRGKNYGLDITLEKYLSGGYYYIATVSLFNSKYKGGDNIWRDTRYNRNFASNFLIGKEWLLGKHRDKILSLNARMSFQGGDRYSPIDTALSVAAQEAVFDETHAFSRQYPPAFISHFTASYAINRKNAVHEFALKILNLNQYKEYFGFIYNYQTQKVDMNREMTFLPNISYKIEF